jgi:hypothetical protein
LTKAKESEPFELDFLPKSLFTIPTEGMREGEVLDAISIYGYTTPPAPGALCLVFPAGEQSQLRKITHLYRVQRFEATGVSEWPWNLYFDHCMAPEPQRWYDLTSHLMFEGLKTVTGVKGKGERITHPETIAEVFRFLGFQLRSPQ